MEVEKMSRVIVAFMVLAASVLAVSCSSSSGPDDGKPLSAPDIPGLVAFYGFNGTLEDGGPGGLDAASTASLTYVEDHAGVPQSALLVDGAIDTIWVANRGAFDITGEITIAAWIQPDLCSMAYNAFVDKSLVEAYSFGVTGAMAPGRTDLVFYVHDDSAYLDEGAPVGEGYWEHVAVTFDDMADTVKFFVDGDFAFAQHFAQSLTVSNDDLMIGSSHWHDDFKGGLDQLAIFERVLTPSEIRQLYEFD
jgi:hypothetical protein